MCVDTCRSRCGLLGRVFCAFGFGDGGDEREREELKALVEWEHLFLDFLEFIAFQ